MICPPDCEMDKKVGSEVDWTAKGVALSWAGLISQSNDGIDWKWRQWSARLIVEWTRKLEVKRIEPPRAWLYHELVWPVSLILELIKHWLIKHWDNDMSAWLWNGQESWRWSGLNCRGRVFIASQDLIKVDKNRFDMDNTSHSGILNNTAALCATRLIVWCNSDQQSSGMHCS